jgi:hypothetical protein
MGRLQRSPVLLTSSLKDGLYRVEYKGVVGGFVIKDGVVTNCADVFVTNFKYFETIAKRIGD